MWKAETSKFSQAEFDRLNETINAYEQENQNHRRISEGLESARVEQQKRIDGYEKKQQQLIKKIAALEGNIRLEKKGFEGLNKKCGLLELELPGLKEEVVNFKQEQLRTRGILSQYEIDLNNDRAKRLQILHENQVLIDRNEYLEAEFKRKEEELLKSHKNQLSNLQTLDTSMASTATLQSIITEQNNSIITMCAEQQSLQTQCRDLTQVNQIHSTEIGQLHITIRAQEDEIRRLRGLILNSTNKPSTGTATMRGNTRGSGLDTQKFGSANDISSLLFTSTVKEGPNAFSNTAKMAVYKDRIAGSDVTKKKIGSIDISFNKVVKKTKKVTSSDSEDSEGTSDEETTQVTPPPDALDHGIPELSRSFGFATKYINPAEELEQLTAYNNMQQLLRRNPSPPLSPNANPYMPANNKVICNKNYTSNSRPSSTALTSLTRPRTTNTSPMYDAATVQALQLLSGKTDILPDIGMMDMSKSMPSIALPNVYSSAANSTVNQIKANSSSPQLLASMDKPPLPSVANSQLNSNILTKKKKKLLSSTSTAKSLYIGSGLGLKHESSTQYNLPAGSTKSMLQKILAQTA